MCWNQLQLVAWHVHKTVVTAGVQKEASFAFLGDHDVAQLRSTSVFLRLCK